MQEPLEDIYLLSKLTNHTSKIEQLSILVTGRNTMKHNEELRGIVRLYNIRKSTLHIIINNNVTMQ